MRLTQLQIVNFRNIEKIQLTPTTGVNLLFGNNASGKTSILEAIYYLSHIKSFRTLSVTDLIRRQTTYLRLLAKIETKDNKIIPLGIQRGRNTSKIRINRETIKRVSDITSKFPVLSIHPDSYKLITGSPSQRRQFLDWGVFHVEHDFFKVWQRYKKALMQRNAALKSKQKLDICQLWNKEISTTAHCIDIQRQKYFNSLSPYFYRLKQLFFDDDVLEINYRRGWPKDIELIDLLENNPEKEYIKGFTYYGPHRAEISLKVNGQSAQTCISRGQQKTLVALMRLAQAMQFTETTNTSCVLLYDDLAAELDENRRNLILSELSTMNIQLFLTAIDQSQLDLSAWQDKKMFHVEQGALCPFS